MTDWPVKTLGDVCDFVRGVTFDKADARSEMKSGFIPLLRATNITEKGLLREDFVFVPKNGVRADQKLMSGDALITIASGSASVVGRSVVVEDPGEMTFGAFCGVLRPSPEILPRYLSHFMSSRSVRTAWSEAAQGTNINNLKRDDILQTECLLPPLEEQKRIVALLDAATARVTELTACYEQARAHANNLFTSALRDALESNPDWPIKTLGDIVCFESETARSEDLSSRDVYVGLENIASDGTLIGLGSVSAETLKSNKARFTDKHILFGKLRPYLVKVVRPDFPGVCSTDILPLEPTAELSRDFLYWYMRSPAVIERATEASTGTTLPRVSPTTLKSFEISVPPLEEQKKIVARLDSMRAKTSEMATAYDAKLTAAKNLRQSILESAFEGKL